MHQAAHPQGPLAHSVHQISVQLRFFLHTVAKRPIGLLEYWFQCGDSFLTHFVDGDVLTFSNENVVSPQKVLLYFLPSHFGGFKLRLVEHKGQFEDVERKHRRQDHSLDRKYFILCDSIDGLLTFSLNSAELITSKQFQFFRANHGRPWCSLCNIIFISNKS